ncbi:orotate phosphoribosyltransferase [Deinococcus sp.]|uniref:orotate phosphoribosyltransferase n=1 Tax=Deinococcus sp. TaxID=47478 RepID=UPI003C79E071
MDLASVLTNQSAMVAGHTALRNGLHSDGWTEKGAIIRAPALLSQVTRAQAEQVRQVLTGLTLVVGASYCGAVVASFVAQHLGLPVAFVNGDGGSMQFHRMHRPTSGQGVLIADDLICTGQDVKAIAAFLRAAGHTVLGVSAWLSRVRLPSENVLTLAPAPFESFNADTCPLCARGVPFAYTDIRE